MREDPDSGSKYLTCFVFPQQGQEVPFDNCKHILTAVFTSLHSKLNLLFECPTFPSRTGACRCTVIHNMILIELLL